MSRSYLLIALAAMLLLSACAPAVKTDLKMAPMSEMPAEVNQASSTTQQAYQYAVANPDMLKNIPCYCGCGDMGHTSNYACYVQSTGADGKPVFEQHALGCSICVDITQDVMRMQKEGKALPEIRAAIDETYSQYGPSNMDPQP